MKKIAVATLVILTLVIYSPLILDFFDRIYIYTFKLGWFRGEKTKEEVVAEYIEGLKAGSSQTIKRLVPKNHESTGIIQEKIGKFSGADFSRVEVLYGGEFQPFQVEVKNIKLGNGEIVSDNIWIEEDCFQYPVVLSCKKWYLMMGKVEEGFKPLSTSELEK